MKFHIWNTAMNGIEILETREILLDISGKFLNAVLEKDGNQMN